MYFNSLQMPEILYPANVPCRSLDLEDSRWSGVSPEAKDLVRRLLVLDPKTRLSAEDALRHAWFQGPLLAAQKTTPAPQKITLAPQKITPSPHAATGASWGLLVPMQPHLPAVGECR